MTTVTDNTAVATQQRGYREQRIAELARKTGQDPRIVKARGFTADEFSVHVATRQDGETRRVASFAGHDYDRALVAMSKFHYDTGRMAWLVRGHVAAYLPLAEAVTQ